MRRACGAPAPRPGKGLRPLTLFRNDTEQGKPIVSARCAMRTHKVCSFQSIFAYRIAQHTQNILYTQDNLTHVRFPVCGMQTQKSAEENLLSSASFWRFARIFIENPVGGVRRPAHGLVYIISRIQAAANSIHSGIRSYCGTLFAILHHFVRYWVQG